MPLWSLPLYWIGASLLVAWGWSWLLRHGGGPR